MAGNGCEARITVGATGATLIAGGGILTVPVIGYEAVAWGDPQRSGAGHFVGYRQQGARHIGHKIVNQPHFRYSIEDRLPLVS